MAINKMNVNIQWGYKSKNILIFKNIGLFKYNPNAFNIAIIIEKVQ